MCLRACPPHPKSGTADRADRNLGESLVVEIGRQVKTVAVRCTNDRRQMMHKHDASRLGRRQTNQDAFLQPPQHRMVQLPASSSSSSSSSRIRSSPITSWIQVHYTSEINWKRSITITVSRPFILDNLFLGIHPAFILGFHLALSFLALLHMDGWMDGWTTRVSWHH